MNVFNSRTPVVAVQVEDTVWNLDRMDFRSCSTWRVSGLFEKVTEYYPCCSNRTRVIVIRTKVRLRDTTPLVFFSCGTIDYFKWWFVKINDIPFENITIKFCVFIKLIWGGERLNTRKETRNILYIDVKIMKFAWSHIFNRGGIAVPGIDCP